MMKHHHHPSTAALVAAAIFSSPASAQQLLSYQQQGSLVKFTASWPVQQREGFIKEVLCGDYGPGDLQYLVVDYGDGSSSSDKIIPPDTEPIKIECPNPNNVKQRGLDTIILPGVNVVSSGEHHDPPGRGLTTALTVKSIFKGTMNMASPNSSSANSLTSIGEVVLGSLHDSEKKEVGYFFARYITESPPYCFTNDCFHSLHDEGTCSDIQVLQHDENNDTTVTNANGLPHDTSSEGTWQIHVLDNLIINDGYRSVYMYNNQGVAFACASLVPIATQSEINELNEVLTEALREQQTETNGTNHTGMSQNESQSVVWFHEYPTQVGTYNATLSLHYCPSDEESGDGSSCVQVKTNSIAQINVTRYKPPTKQENDEPKKETIRFFTYNTAISDNVVAIDAKAGEVGRLTRSPPSVDTKFLINVACIIQMARPDVMLLQEYNYENDANGNQDMNATLQSVSDFQKNYLLANLTRWGCDAEPLQEVYAHVFVADVNTGTPYGCKNTRENPCQGFAWFPGQYGMVFLSKYAIKRDAVRTFQKFLWKDMPNAFTPRIPNASLGFPPYYSDEWFATMRLSSKTHWDIPIVVPAAGGNKTELVHILAAHPTPPVFDDGQSEVYPSPLVSDWNGLRNHDEIRFWIDYISTDPSSSEYIYDDQGRRGGLHTMSSSSSCSNRFVLMGDYNCDMTHGDCTFPATSLGELLRSSPLVSLSSEGAMENVPSGISSPSNKTMISWLRLDYILLSEFGFNNPTGFVFWPKNNTIESQFAWNAFDKKISNVGMGASDHFAVVLDAEVDSDIIQRCQENVRDDDAKSPSSGSIMPKAAHSYVFVTAIFSLFRSLGTL